MKNSKKRGMNKVVFFLTMSDVFSWGPFLIISALSGIYLSNKLGVDAIKFVGIGTSIYFVTRALFQIPVGIITDKIKSDKDEILVLAIGTILMGLPYTLYPHISIPMHYYILQFIFGLGVSLSVNNWRKLFAMNVDSGIEGYQYAVYDTFISLSTAILCIVVGIVANLGDVYFDIVMISAGTIMMLASVWALLIYGVKSRKTNLNK